MATRLKKRAEMTDEEMCKIIEEAWKEFHGDCAVFMSAVGALAFGRMVGWHGVRVTMSAATYRKYEKILGPKFRFRDHLPERTLDSQNIRGIRIVDGIGKFWQALSGGLVPATEGRIKLEAI